MILIRHGADVPRLVPNLGVLSGAAVALFTCDLFTAGLGGVEASTVGSDPGTLLGSLGSSICATVRDLNKKPQKQTTTKTSEPCI